jgi:hypothetical protein
MWAVFVLLASPRGFREAAYLIILDDRAQCASVQVGHSAITIPSCAVADGILTSFSSSLAAHAWRRPEVLDLLDTLMHTGTSIRHFSQDECSLGACDVCDSEDDE